MTGSRAILWKELREQHLRGGRPALHLVWTALVVVLVGIATALLAHETYPRDALRFAALAALWGSGALAFLSFLTPAAVIVDAVAGERERHTLETLLASPASDGAILWGKMGLVLVTLAGEAALLSCTMAVAGALVAGVAGLLAALATLVLGSAAALLTGVLVTSLGMLISLRASTVKQGQQWLGLLVMPIFLVVGLAPGLLRQGVPGVPPEVAGGVAAGLLLLMDAGLLVTVHRAFRRDRLLLRR